jgi:hypothetical protein
VSQRAALDKGNTVQCDTEVMVEQAVILRASSQGESMEQCWAWPLAARNAGPGAPPAKAGQDMAWQWDVTGAVGLGRRHGRSVSGTTRRPTRQRVVAGSQGNSARVYARRNLGGTKTWTAPRCAGRASGGGRRAAAVVAVSARWLAALARSARAVRVHRHGSRTQPAWQRALASQQRVVTAPRARPRVVHTF